LKQRRQEEKEELNRLISKKENLQEQIDELFKRRDIMQIDFRAQKETLDNQIADAQNQRNEKLESIRLAESGFSELEEIGYEKYIPTMLSDDIERKIFKVELDIGELMVKDNVIIIERHYTIDKSTSKGEKFQKVFGKNLLTGFNTYVQVKTKSVTENNYNRTCELIKNSFEKFNKQGKMVGIYLNSKYLDLCIEKLKYILELKIKKAKEKAQLREERKRMREQEKLLEDIAKEEKRLEEESKSMDIAFAKALTEKERQEIKIKMAKIDRRMEDLKYRREHNNAGWLYVISSPSLPDMCKIGCTRRLNPTIRVKELSSSSLPYAFRTHGFVFSDNCFELETQMHHYFDDKRVASDREFFYITPQQAIDVLKNKFNQEIHFEEENMEDTV
jgi:hypothetical protein